MSPVDFQPNEIGIVDRDFTYSDHLNKKVSMEMFDGVMREVVEETGVPTQYLVKLLNFAISTRSIFLVYLHQKRILK